MPVDDGERVYHPWKLPWREVDPARHPFDADRAFAKAGRERYGVRPRAEFDAHLAGARPGGVPVASRAARAYLDVCFFHPFADGNARAALLALVFVLGRDRVVLDRLGPLPVLTRWADDPVAAVDLVRLLRVLVRQAGRRHGVRTSGPP